MEDLVERFLKKSLESLKLDYVDLYLIHVPFGLKFVVEETLFPMDGDVVNLDMLTDHVGIWKGCRSRQVNRSLQLQRGPDRARG